MQKTVDVVIVGGGIMSATLGTLLQKLEPSWSIELYERLGAPAEESTNPWNNAGTGHAALCELNYTPELADGTIGTAGAIKVNEQFQVSRQFWATLVAEGTLPAPEQFIVPVPHMSFVWGQNNVDYLRRRFEALKDHPLFTGMQYTEDPTVIHQWAPLLMPGRSKSEPVAATFYAEGTDVNFGALTEILLDGMKANGAVVRMNTTVKSLKRQKDGLWKVSVRNEIGKTPSEVFAKFVFVGAGGYALNLLQRSGIPEIKGFAGFPVSGQFYRCDDPTIVAQHQAKVYGRASVGAPPMSVPHLDTRLVDGDNSLLFGPYAGFTPKFLKSGSLIDLFRSIRPGNIVAMIQVALTNFGLVKYLAGEVFASRAQRVRSLREYFPQADPSKWYLYNAGQRVQVIKTDSDKGGILQFGTEVVAHKDGSIAGLLGASPGASTAVSAMLDVLEKCFPQRMNIWREQIVDMIPSYGTVLSDDPKATAASLKRTAKALKLS